MPRSSARGLSLVEVLVAAGLAFLVIFMALEWLSRGGRLARQISTRCALQQEALVICNQLTADLGRSAQGGLSLRPANPFVAAIHRLSGGAYPGTLFREGELQVYYWRAADQILWKRVWGPVPTASWYTCPDDASLLALAASGQRKLSSRVAALTLTLDRGVATVEIRLQDRDPRTFFQTSRSLFLRNHP